MLLQLRASLHSTYYAHRNYLSYIIILNIVNSNQLHMDAIESAYNIQTLYIMQNVRDTTFNDQSGRLK